jgi:hypothetical protein
VSASGNAEPGRVRIRGTAERGAPILIGDDVRIEVQQSDGAWLMLRGVCACEIRILPRDIVRARLDMEIAAVDLSGAHVDVTVWRDGRSRWQRFLAGLR